MYVLKSPEDNFKDGVAATEVEALEHGELNPWQIVLLMQDILEAGLLHVLPHKFITICAYYAEIGLISTNRRAKH